MAAVRSGCEKCGQVHSGLRSAGLHARASRTALGPARSSPGEAVEISISNCHYIINGFIITICGADELHGSPERALGAYMCA